MNSKSDRPSRTHQPAAVGVATFVWLGVMVLLWGASWPVTKLALATVSPLWLAAIRFGSAAICLFGFVWWKGQLCRPPVGDWSIVASMGMLQMMAFTGLGMIAMTRTDTSHAVLLAYTTHYGAFWYRGLRFDRRRPVCSFWHYLWVCRGQR
jgi:drug/metabolite transporter (DMT)-like permease